MSQSIPSITITSSIVVRVLGIIIGILILASITGSVFRFALGFETVYGFAKVYLDRENNIPTYFSSFILLISAGLLGIIAISERRKQNLYSIHWLILSIIFLCLSVDESASLHELLIEPLRRAWNLSGIFYYSWVIPGFMFVVFFAVFYRKFVLALPSRTRYLFLVAALLYISGALGVELAGAYHADSVRGPGDIYGEDNVMFMMIITVEESLEMLGVLVFINALLKYIVVNISDVRFSFK